MLKGYLIKIKFKPIFDDIKYESVTGVFSSSVHINILVFLLQSF